MAERRRKVTFRLCDKEFAHLKELVEKSGWSQEAYLRALVAGIVPAERPPPDYLSMARELHAIGVNLNQIARKAHALGCIDAKRFDDEANRLAAAITEITAAVKEPKRR